jgi:hypothetical protein
VLLQDEFRDDAQLRCFKAKYKVAAYVVHMKAIAQALRLPSDY